MDLHDAIRIVGRIVAIIATVECLIMLLLGFGPWDLSTFETALVDTVLLVCLTTPLMYLWVIRPYIDARDEAHAEAHRLASSDPLTHLPNRRTLDAFLDKMLSGAKRYRRFGAVMVMDLDDFKPVNDRYGHAIGDAVLVEVAKRLEQVNRHEDMVARIGGDEFVVVLTYLSYSLFEAEFKARTVAQKIGATVRRPIRQGSAVLSIGCSIGIAMMGPDSDSVEELIRQADEGMYAAKGTKARYAIYRPAELTAGRSP